MAQLKDTVVLGNLRATDQLIATTTQIKNLLAQGSAGTANQVLRSTGSAIEWHTLTPSDVGAVALNQGSSNANKWLVCNSNGVVEPKTITALQSSEITITGVTIKVPKEHYTTAADITKNLTSLTIPKDVPFSITTADDTSLDTTSDLTVTNGAYRRAIITNNANGTIATLTNNGSITTLTNAGAINTITNNSGKTITTITNAGTITTLENTGSVTVKSTDTSNGTVKINAYNNASTPALEGDKQIVSGGKWQCVPNAVNAAGTYYGRAVVPSVSPALTFSAAPTGGSTATPTNITFTESGTTNGLIIQTKYTIDSVAIKYTSTSSGWVATTANTNTSSNTTAKAATNGTAYYIEAMTIPVDDRLTVTTTGTDSQNASSALEITNGTYRTIEIDNSGIIYIDSISNSSGTVSIAAYNLAGDTLETSVSIVNDGKWETTAVTAPGTYYGKVIVPEGRIIQVTVPARTSGGSGILAIQVTGMTEDYYLINEHQIIANDMEWDTTNGYITLEYTGNYESMNLYFAKVVT